jgi:endonuclease/exonuclease/phosphatase family metal-dependent hydrolase
VGLLTKFPIRGIRTNIYDGTSTSRIFSRDCLELDLELPDGRMLYVLCNHFVSKMNGDPPSSRKRRLRQAQRVAEILSGYNLKRDLVIVAGDMNDTPDSPAMKPLVNLPGLHDVLE